MSIEKRALEDVLVPCLRKLGHVVSKRTGKATGKTFDLSLDGGVAELKAKGKPFSDIDFITYTENQFKAINNGPEFDTYIVCGVNSVKAQIFRVSSKHLKNLPEHKWTLYCYYKGDLEKLRQRGLMEEIL